MSACCRNFKGTLYKSLTLYVFEIKVDDYDRIYAGELEVEEEPVIEEEPEIEEPEIIEEPIVEEEPIPEEPELSLEDIDFIDEIDEEADDGIEVIGVVWPEKEGRKSKIYRYDPNGEQVDDGDIVLVPTHDRTQNCEVVRKAAVAHGNHKVPKENLHYPLKKIIEVVKRNLQNRLE